MGIVLGITSGKGGTGKSTVTCGLAIAFSMLGKRVLTVDLDEGLRCLDLMMGVENSVVYDLSDILLGGCIENSIYQSPFYKNIGVIPAPNESGTLNYINLNSFVNSTKDSFDVIILDFPAGTDFSHFSSINKHIRFITVCNMDPVSIRDAAAVFDILPKMQTEPRLIINRFNAEYIKDGVFDNIDTLIDRSKTRLIGIVPGSMELMMFSLSHKLTKRGKPLSAFLRIAKRISGEQVPLPNPKKI